MTPSQCLQAESALYRLLCCCTGGLLCVGMGDSCGDGFDRIDVDADRLEGAHARMNSWPQGWRDVIVLRRVAGGGLVPRLPSMFVTLTCVVRANNYVLV